MLWKAVHWTQSIYHHQYRLPLSHSSPADELALGRNIASQVTIHSQPVSSSWPTSVTSSPFSLQGAHHYPEFLVYLDFSCLFSPLIAME